MKSKENKEVPEVKNLLNVEGQIINMEKAYDLKPDHIRMIDEYINNGGNKSGAYRSVKKEVNASWACNKFNDILRSPEGQAYYQSRIKEIRENANIKPLEILQKLKNWLDADVSEFIGLGPDDIKQLPPELRRSIQSYDHNIKTYTQRDGTKVKEESIKVKLTDKHKALEAINKHIGFYSEDNRQKAPQINIKELSVNTLNALLKATNK